MVRSARHWQNRTNGGKCARWVKRAVEVRDELETELAPDRLPLTPGFRVAVALSQASWL